MSVEILILSIVIVVCVSAVALEWIKRKYPDGS